MKILAAGDIHSDIRQVKKLAERAEKENVDLVVLCGDLTHFEESTEGIIGPFLEKKKKVIIIPGNHEHEATCDFLAELYGVRNLHGKGVRYDDVGLFGCGGANVGPFLVPEDEMSEKFAKAFETISYLPKKIMVSHTHPAGSKMERFTKFFPGSRAVRETIERFQPDICFCSHVHEAEGIEERIGKTLVMNVGKSGKIVEF